MPIDILPFPVAVLDGGTCILEANAEWRTAYPAAARGTSLSSWCEGLGAESGFGDAVVGGVKRVLDGGEPRFSYDFSIGQCRQRITAAVWSGSVLFMVHASGDDDPHSRKMQTAGRLLSGVAHDFANLLTMIAGYSDLLLSRIGEKDSVRPELEEIRKAANRGAHLTAQLLGFSRRSSVEPRPVDLNSLISEMERMLRPIIGEQVRFHAVLTPHLGKVMVDPGQMEQVVMNLVLNARDAVSAGGRILLETRGCELDEAAARQHGIAPGPCVLLSVQDDGHGIEPGVIDHIFEPFFTTKEKGKGTGLGLSTVYNVIKDAGGDISVSSVPGKGSTFTLCLPAIPVPVEAGDSPPLPRAVPEGSETILLVEDEDGVRKLLTHVLRRRGYQVLEACDGEEALRVFESRPSSIDLVLTDMIMPRMSGRELADHLRVLRPETRVIFMSGYTDEVLNRTGALGPGMSLLQKPLRPDQLAARVREALDSPPRPFNPR